MLNLKDFINSKGHEDNNLNKHAADAFMKNKQASGINRDKTELAQDILKQKDMLSNELSQEKIDAARGVINKYANMSESELAMHVAQTIKEQKAGGVFDKDAVIKQIDAIGDLITPEQKEKMTKLLNELSGK